MTWLIRIVEFVLPSLINWYVKRVDAKKQNNLVRHTVDAVANIPITDAEYIDAAKSGKL